MEIDFNFVQSANALSPIVVKFEFSPNEILSNSEHTSNALIPIDSTEEEIEIDFNNLHSLKT